jgi:polysaccharide biosynthesis/export protein VpsN
MVRAWASFRGVVIRALRAGSFALLASLSAGPLGCSARSDNTHIKLAAPVESTTLGPGDVFTMDIVGEKDLPRDYQVASDGTVDLPYLNAIKVAGLEPQEVARLIRQELAKRQILTNPSVIVSVTQYNSKRVTVLGQVQKPGSFPLSPGITLVQAISLAGGFNAIAKRNSVVLTRKTKDGTQTVSVDVESINDGSSKDIPLQAGDQIYVNERLF